MILYRYNYERNYLEPGVQLVVKEYTVFDETTCGYWIKDTTCKDHRRWIRKDAKKRFAYESKEQALEGFVHRKRRQIEIMETQLENVKEAFAMAEKIVTEREEKSRESSNNLEV